ncbi:calcium/sodium antiporter [Flavimaricola marinus]|uniref:Inner membrane protein YrbG n=1 Tax=Flavimaricola marinus TaxID=1819565 RepID=A0A238LHG6_9RHOB|nr:calcium/sodium antiporter [Flavimaricola marinus]SMY08983.1 Inner membrane protein YrbG [Flavimaricola marinus]
MDYILIVTGLAGLFLGGEALVRGSVQIARRLGISPMVIGLTVVGFGTSTPELLVSLQAALNGVPDIAIGNIVGSNIANILLILGLTALIRPIRMGLGTLRRDIGVMIGAALLLLPLFGMGEISRPAGAVLVAALGGYLVWTLVSPGTDNRDDEIDGPAMGLPGALLWVIVGFVALLFGARFLVDGAVSVARTFGLSEAFIGLSIVAVGTSLPELATSLIAAMRRQSDIAIGNVIGSNIFNVLGILGTTALITPIPVAARFLGIDLPVMLGVSVLLAVLLLLWARIGRGMGVAMLIGYAGYIGLAQ